MRRPAPLWSTASSIFPTGAVICGRSTPLRVPSLGSTSCRIYGLPADTVSRTSPAVHDHTVYIGMQAGAFLLAINAKTGDLRWKTQLDIQPGRS
jgi:outer membrane protein assembly factor BamB